MATKDQVLKLLEKGLNPQQIAKKLKCSDGYVRATKARAFGNGLEVQRRYDQGRKAEHAAYQRRRYATDPKFRARHLQACKRWHARKAAEQSQSAN